MVASHGRIPGLVTQGRPRAVKEPRRGHRRPVYPHVHAADAGVPGTARSGKPARSSRSRHRFQPVYLCIAAACRNARSCRQQGLPGLPWCAGVLVRRACRRGTVPWRVELIEGHGAGGEREPGRDARMPPGSRTGLRDGRAGGRVPADPGRSGAGRRTPARNHRVGRGSGRRPDARERRGGAGRYGPGSPGYRRVRLPGASRPVVSSR